MPKQKDNIEEKIDNIYLGKYKGISGDEVMVYLLERLDNSTNRLKYLTIALLILTAVLAVLTALQVWCR